MIMALYGGGLSTRIPNQCCTYFGRVISSEITETEPRPTGYRLPLKLITAGRGREGAAAGMLEGLTSPTRSILFFFPKIHPGGTANNTHPPTTVSICRCLQLIFANFCAQSHVFIAVTAVQSTSPPAPACLLALHCHCRPLLCCCRAFLLLGRSVLCIALGDLLDYIHTGLEQ